MLRVIILRDNPKPKRFLKRGRRFDADGAEASFPSRPYRSVCAPFTPQTVFFHKTDSAPRKPVQFGAPHRHLELPFKEDLLEGVLDASSSVPVEVVIVRYFFTNLNISKGENGDPLFTTDVPLLAFRIGIARMVNKPRVVADFRCVNDFVGATNALWDPSFERKDLPTSSS